MSRCAVAQQKRTFLLRKGNDHSLECSRDLSVLFLDHRFQFYPINLALQNCYGYGLVHSGVGGVETVRDVIRTVLMDKSAISLSFTSTSCNAASSYSTHQQASTRDGVVYRVLHDVQ